MSQSVHLLDLLVKLKKENATLNYKYTELKHQSVALNEQKSNLSKVADLTTSEKPERTPEYKNSENGVEMIEEGVSENFEEELDEEGLFDEEENDDDWKKMIVPGADLLTQVFACELKESQNHSIKVNASQRQYK